MAEPAVVDASPLIFLAGAGLCELTQLAGTPVFIPRVVLEEIERFGPTDPTAMGAKQLHWLTLIRERPQFWTTWPRDGVPVHLGSRSGAPWA